MENLQYVDGYVDAPKSSGPQIIAHICNDLGDWCGETARSITRRWPEAERAFKRWYLRRLDNDFGLGTVQFVNVNRTHVNRVVRVANMVARRGTRPHPGSIRYQIMAWCLGELSRKASQIGASVHLPKIGIDQFEHDWSAIESLIRCVLCDVGIRVFIYQPPSKSSRILFCETQPTIRQTYELLD